MKNLICTLSIILFLSCGSRYKLESTETTIENNEWEGALIAVYESELKGAFLPSYLIIKETIGQCDLVHFSYGEAGEYTFKQDTLTFYARYSYYSDQARVIANPTKYIFVKKGNSLIHIWYDKSGKKYETPFKRLGGSVSAPLFE